MLTNLTLENFKAFQKLDDLKIKPITILCGTNSCGKSSILQSILLLKQTLESQNPTQNLILNGRFVELGALQNLIYKKNEENQLKFSFTFSMDSNGIITMPNGRKTSVFTNLLGLFGEEALGVKKYRINYNVSLHSSTEDRIESQFFFKSLDVKDFSIIIENDVLNDSSFKKIISATHIENDLYEIRWENYFLEPNLPAGAIKADIRFANLFPRSYRVSGTSLNDGLMEKLLLNLYRLGEMLQSLLYSYSYIGPLRLTPKRMYVYDNEVREIGNQGENAPYLYLTEQHKRIENHYFYTLSIDSFELLPNQTLHSALKKWFDLMKIPHFEAEITNKIIYLNMEASTYDETRVGIADVGFGVSQIFPIILEGLRMEKGATLMLEQPEIHLHPNLQMQMADYFISLALSGKQVLVETHSDHVINRLVRRIVEDETHNLQDLIGIYFIKPSENGSVYEEVKIDETKGIVNWPPDFFDQTANEQMKIMQAGLKKRKNQRIPANGNAS